MPFGQAANIECSECPTAGAKLYLSLVLRDHKSCKHKESLSRGRAIRERLSSNNPLAGTDLGHDLSILNRLYSVFDGRFMSMDVLEYSNRRS